MHSLYKTDYVRGESWRGISQGVEPQFLSMGNDIDLNTKAIRSRRWVGQCRRRPHEIPVSPKAEEAADKVHDLCLFGVQLGRRRR